MFSKHLKRKSSATNIVNICLQPLEPYGSSSSVNYEKDLSFRSLSSSSSSEYLGSTFTHVNTTSIKSASKWTGLVSCFPFLAFFLPPSQPPAADPTLGGIQVHKDILITSDPAFDPEGVIIKSRRRQRFTPHILVTDADNYTSPYITGDENIVNSSASTTTAIFGRPLGSSSAADTNATGLLPPPPWTISKNALLSIPNGAARYPPTAASLRLVPPLSPPHHERGGSARERKVMGRSLTESEGAELKMMSDDGGKYWVQVVSEQY